jgi:exosortase/archaeosortase family protein
MSRVVSAWSRPNLRFLSVAVTLVSIFALAYRDDLLGRFLGPLEVLTAQATVALLHLLNIEAVRAASQIHHPGGFAYEIYYRCTGALPIAILSIFILAYPAAWRHKITGLIVGIPLLIALNLVRLIHLFYVGVHAPAEFDMFHGLVWEGIIIMATLGLWWIWSLWADRPGLPIPDQPSLQSGCS